MMDDPDQALASPAPTSKKRTGVRDRFVEFYPEFKVGHVLDLGCGPADIPIRLTPQAP